MSTKKVLSRSVNTKGVKVCKEGVKISQNLNFFQLYLPQVLNLGAIYNFLSVKILKGWPYILIFKIMDWKK